ncbi:MAG TPA: glycosyltransferase family 87 protein [Candidatus Acidoferrum sp.]|nr:glycosyltransferase family 87 protein [Candidatus Acidoferrum sp.]
MLNSRTGKAMVTQREDLTNHLINVAPAIPALALMLVAIPIHYVADFGLAYQGGLEAWATGHPMRVVTWMGTPFYAMVMALVTRTGPEFVGARVFMAINLSLWLLLLSLVWPRLRPHVSTRWWWSTLVAAGLFAPALSTIFWLQINLLVFCLALAGFFLAGRNNRLAGVLIGVSVAIKPVLILLPLALLLRRRSRTAGVWTIVAGAAATAAGFVFLAWRAQDVTVLNPFAYLADFMSKSRLDIAACIVENYSPVAALCRFGLPPATPTSAVIAVIVLAVGWFLVRDVPETDEGEWEVFAAACFLSILIGPIDWAHYGLLTGPMFLVLAYQFWRDRAPRVMWIELGAAYALAELVWDPLSTQLGASIPFEIFVYTAGQFSQYFLLLVWIRWRRLKSSAEPIAAPA